MDVAFSRGWGGGCVVAARIRGLQNLQYRQAYAFRSMLLKASFVVAMYSFYRMYTHGWEGTWQLHLCELLTVAAPALKGWYLLTGNKLLSTLSGLLSLGQLCFYFSVVNDKFTVDDCIPLGTIFVLLVWGAEQMLDSTQDTMRDVREELGTGKFKNT